ncbi:MAG: hypothetical protein PVSMB7_24790 [Chloroflexota bacterium]
MDKRDHESKVDKATEKAQDALGKFMDDPEKVEKAKTKAEGFLGKYMAHDDASKAVNELEGMLGTFAHQPEHKDSE